MSRRYDARRIPLGLRSSGLLSLKWACWCVLRSRVDGERRLTVEFDPHSKRIVQARGSRNRPADHIELKVLEGWLAMIACQNPAGVERTPAEPDPRRG